jgi:large subunit ribosomal protein L5
MDNIMQKLRIDKVTVNIGAGESGDKLDKAKKLLQTLTARTPVLTTARKRVQVFGIRKGDTIGVKVTLRRKPAEEFLAKAFDTIDSKISKRAFDKFGNFSFGIKQYIDFPGIRYDPSVGLIGFDVCVTLTRPGYRVTLRKHKRSVIPNSQRGTIEESIALIKEKFGVSTIES